MRRLPALLVAIAMALGVAGCAKRETATIIIDPSVTFQTMDAWEATAKMWEFDKGADRFDGSWLPIRDRILTKLIEEGGINRLRLEILSGAENPVDYWSQFRSGRIGYLAFKSHFYEKINDNDDPFVLNPVGVQFAELDFRVETLVLPAMRIAQRLGRPMRFTLCYVDFGWTDRKGNLSHAKNPEEYAELIAAAYAHLKRKYGLTPAALEIILEPDNSDDWRGKQIGEAIISVSKRLEAQGMKPRIIAPSISVGRRTPVYFDELEKVPGAADRVSVISYHRYGGVLPDGTLDQIGERAQRIGAQTAMLEYTHGTIDDLFDDLIKANVTSWQKYGIAMIDKGVGAKAPGNMLRVVHPARANPDIGLLPGSAAMAHMFRAVDPGAVRIGARTDREWAQAVAFRNPDGRIAVTVKADRGFFGTSIETLSSKLGIPPPQPDAGRWTRIRGLAAGRYLVQRADAVNGDTLRCAIDVKAGGSAAVYLRGGDAATLSMAEGKAATEAPCPSTVPGWQ